MVQNMQTLPGWKNFNLEIFYIFVSRAAVPAESFSDMHYYVVVGRSTDEVSQVDVEWMKPITDLSPKYEHKNRRFVVVVKLHFHKGVQDDDPSYNNRNRRLHGECLCPQHGKGCNDKSFGGFFITAFSTFTEVAGRNSCSPPGKDRPSPKVVHP
jgi:hypothetical protein